MSRQNRNEELEVKLGYQTLLAKELKLPRVSHEMLFPKIANISDDAKEAAVASVLASEDGPELMQLTAQCKPWR